MLVSKNSVILLCAFLSCLGAEIGAQQMKRVSGPIRSVSLDLATGTITRGPIVDEKGTFTFNTVSVMNNVSFSGFAGVDTGPGAPAYGPCEWYVAMPTYGTGRTGGESHLITALTFLYCSAAKDTLSGGPGGTSIISFREGYVLGTAANAGGPSGTLRASFLITGLPANTGSTSFFGNTPCYFIQVGLPVTVISDTTLAYAWQFNDLGTDGILAQTFPWLACVQSCTGPGPDMTGGMIDFVDQYCPSGGAPRSSFTFGTFGGGANYFTSVSMDIRQAERSSSSNVFNNGVAMTNPAVMMTLGTGPALGELWGLSTDCTGADSAKLSIWVLGFVPITPIIVPFGERIVSITPGTFVSFAASHNGGVVDLGPFPLPLDLQFLNACWTAQGFCGDTPKGFLTNGFDQFLGSPKAPPKAPTCSISVSNTATKPTNRTRTTVGVGELTSCTFTSSQTGQVTWSKVSGNGTFSPAIGTTTVFTAPDRASVTKLRATQGALVCEVTFTTIEPSGVTITIEPGTTTWHVMGTASAGFCGRCWITPNTVSFANIQVRELAVAGVGIGYFLPINGLMHMQGPWADINEGTAAMPSKKNAIDKIRSGAQPAPYAAGTFTWPIPWVFRVGAGAQKTFATVNHVQTITAAGKMTMAKGGSSVSKVPGDPDDASCFPPPPGALRGVVLTSSPPFGLGAVNVGVYAKIE